VTVTEVEGLLKRSAVFLDQFAGCFGRQAQRGAAQRYVRGLLSEKPRKAILAMVDERKSTAVYQSLQHFITDAPWDAERVWRRLRKMTPAGPGLVLLDDTGFPKQGTHSVGVARQYSGTLGKVGNCQVAVGAVLAQRDSSWPLGFELYLPEAWADDPDRRERAEIPPSVGFQEKWRIALQLLDRSRREGVLIDAVVADAGYGEVTAFRRALSGRRLRYVVGVSEQVKVRREGKELGRSVTVAALALSLPPSAWHGVKWRDGTKGPLRACFAAVLVRPTHGWKPDGPWPRLEWLLCERSLKGGGRRRYYLSNLPPTTVLQRLVALAHARWQIEQYFQNLKDEIGIDHFEGRSYGGWHHHTALAALTFALIESERHRHGVTRKTFPFLRRLVRGVVFILMAAEKNEYTELLLHFRKHPPQWGWGFG